MRRDTARQNFEIVANAATRPGPLRWAPGLAALGIALILLTSLFLARSAQAEPAAPDPGAAVSVALLALAVEALEEEESTPEPVVGELFVVPHGTLYRSDAELADDSIAAAVTRGTNPDLIRRTKFRKRSIDLFRTEHEVRIGQRDMLVRLRLRAKSRNAMSVQLRF